MPRRLKGNTEKCAEEWNAKYILFGDFDTCDSSLWPQYNIQADIVKVLWKIGTGIFHLDDLDRENCFITVLPLGPMRQAEISGSKAGRIMARGGYVIRWSIHPRTLEHDNVMNWKQENNGMENFIFSYEASIGEVTISGGWCHYTKQGHVWFKHTELISHNSSENCLLYLQAKIKD